MPFTPSIQQADFLRWCRENGGSCVLEAVAGSGKTTTLIEAVKVFADQGRQVAIMAYNRKIADEISKKIEARGYTFREAKANTVHGFGMAAYRKARPSVRINENKLVNLLEPLVPEFHQLAVFKPSICKLVSLAKQKAFGLMLSMTDAENWIELADHFDVFDNGEEDVETPLEEIITVAIDLLKHSRDQLDVIDFDDMVYMPLVHKVRFWQYDIIMVDEAQDTNAARRALVRAMLRKGGRVIAVGDRHQAIYGFTGADADSLDLIANDFSAIRLPLTVTYRCPKNVVSFSQQWVSHITAAPEAPDGSVQKISMDDFLKRNDLTKGTAVLCRVTKPLVSLAFTLIRARIACKVEGRDISRSIIKLMLRWKVSSLDALETRLENYLARETTKLLAKKQEAKLALVEDSVETVKVIIDQCRREKKTKVADAVAYVESLFGEDVTDVMVLSTIHKSKGREWPRVFWLDRLGTCPSKWARQEWQRDQEVNLQYVAATRSMDQLYDLQPKERKAA